MKALRAKDAQKFIEIPNVGPRIAHDFKVLGLKTPSDLSGKDPFKLYKKLCVLTKSRQDPCVLDTFMAAVAFMNGEKALVWWAYTPERKRLYPNV
jgi:hypothetical protein